MILSVSRRTDITNYYYDWFYNRIKEGFLYVRNPWNPNQVSRLGLSPGAVDCIVFWTKNPEPMLGRLRELSSYNYYFQFTLTGYGRDIECHVPHKKEQMIPIFQQLSSQIGRKRVIWRYDPILFNGTYTPEYHLKAFSQISGSLSGYTEKCVLSFVDSYAKNRRNMEALGTYGLEDGQLVEFAGQLSKIARANGMEPVSCGEAMDLSGCGISHNSCIDRELIEELAGYRIKARKDRNQRKECGCIESVDVGTYNTCQNGCKYCYANFSPESVRRNTRQYDVNSSLLCGKLTEKDRVTDKKMVSFQEGL